MEAQRTGQETNSSTTECTGIIDDPGTECANPGADYSSDSLDSEDYCNVCGIWIINDSGSKIADGLAVVTLCELCTDHKDQAKGG